MKKLKLVYIILFILLLSNGSIESIGQSVANYNVTRNTGITYNSILSTGNSFSGWRYTGAFSEDDNRSNATDIGFDFWYNGQRYTQFSVSTNGFMDFSSSTDDGGPNCDDYGYCNFRFSDATSANGTWNALAPFYDDMTTGGGIDPLGTSIKYRLTGSSPNRVLTVEWDAMAVYQNTTPDINFQVKIYETTGAIEYWYETMQNGTKTFSYTIGINASSLSNPPTAAELLAQQNANSTVFSNTAQDNLSIMPTDNSQLAFTPPMPLNPSGTLAFTGTSNTSTTLNWTNWASNEVGYVIYYSTDDVNYYFNSQTSANATSATINNLLPSTTYYFKVLAVTEGALSTALSGNITTLAPGTITSVATGRWDRTGTWDCACIPTSADNVIIADGDRVTMRTNGLVCNDLTVGQGSSGELRFNRNNARDLTVNGNIIINAGAIFWVNTSSNATHTLNIRGDINNAGTLNLASDTNSLCDANFTKPDGNQLVSGAGVTTGFYTINIDKSQINNQLEITSTHFNCDPDALNFVSGGTFKFSSPGANTFSLFSTAKTIPANGIIWMNSTNGVMNFESSINLAGKLQLDDGIINVGNAADENLISNGGNLEINGGQLNIAGRFDRNTSESTSTFIQSSGVLTVPTVGSTSTTQSPFGMDVIGSNLQLSGGSIVLQQEGGSGTENLGYNTSGVSSSTITGGTLQIGNNATPTSQVLQINTSTDLGNLILTSANASAQLVTNNVNILSNITLTAGNFDANDLNISLGGDWLANGGSFTPSSLGTVTFSGGNQSITSGGSAFNNLTLSGSGNKSIQDNLSVNGNLLINASMVAVNTGIMLTIGGNWTNNASFTRNDETLSFNGSATQTIGGSATNNFTNIIINKTGGSVINESTLNLYQSLAIQSSTPFDADGALGTSNFSMISSASEESSIGILPAGASITGNVRAEKYLPLYGSKRWRNIGFPVVNATVADLQSEIPISGSFTGSDNGTGSIPVNASGSLAYYDNTIGLVSETLDDRWVLYPTTDNNAVVTTTGTEARGYAVWIRDLTDVTFDVTGLLNQGNIDFSPTGSFERWNLMGNPYPSTINWDATGWSKAGIQGNTIHVWDGLQYQTWNGTLGSMGDGLIAKGQAFWIEGSQASMTLTATESVKSTTTGTTYRTNGEPQFLELVITDNTYSDKAYIHFSNGAANSFDTQDAGKLLNYIFSFSTLSSDSVQLSINAISPSVCDQTIPFALEYSWQGNYTLQWNNLESLDKNLTLKIYDDYTGLNYDLRSQNSFKFNINQDAASNEKYRFYLKIGSIKIDKQTSILSSNLCDTPIATIDILNSQTGINYTFKTLTNEHIMEVMGTDSTASFLLDSTYLSLGETEFLVSANAGYCEEALLDTIQISKSETPIIIYNDSTNTLATQYQPNLSWYKDGGLITTTNDTLVQLNGNKTAAYTVSVKNKDCSLTSAPYLITGISPQEAKTNLGVSVYPNPFTNELNVTFSNTSALPEVIQLIDISGKVLIQNKVKSNGSQQLITSQLPSGIYFLKLTFPTSSQTIKLLK